MKIKDILDKDFKLPHSYESKIGYDNLIQIIILEELMNLVGTIIVEIDIEIKMDFSRIKHLEGKKLINCKYTLVKKETILKIL